MAKSFIPSAYAAYNLFFKNICQCVNEKTTGQSPAWTHIPADEVTALNAAYADWYNAYAPTLKPHTPGEAALVKPAYRKSHKVLSRFIQVWIRGFPDIITAKDRAALEPRVALEFSLRENSPAEHPKPCFGFSALSVKVSCGW